MTRIVERWQFVAIVAILYVAATLISWRFGG
jgi:hypothetical protein